MTKTFLEAQEKTAVFTYGRNNPPTVGHEKLFDKTIEVAKQHGAKANIYTSHSQDSKKNPLSAEHKVKLIKSAYPQANVGSSSREMPSLIHIAKKLHEQGHQHLVMVAGSDRVDEYHKLLNKYNGHPDHYNFKSIRVVSAGHRDPDAEGAAGMSGTKLRSHAAAGNKKAFKSGLMSKLSDEHKEDVYNKVRSSMNVKEEYKYEWGTPEATRAMKKMTPGEATEVPQDKDIASRAGTQPAKYHSGLSKSTKAARDAQFKKQTQMGSRDPAAYKPAPGDKDAETKPSKYTMMYKKLYEKKIPVLLKNYKLIKEDTTGQIEFDGIHTRNFDQCPVAYEKFMPLVKKMNDGELIMSPAVKEIIKPTPTDTRKLMQFKYYTEQANA